MFTKKIYLPYTVGIGNIFSIKDIEIAKRSTSFEREYNLKFLGLVGNVFLPEKMDEAILLGREFDIYRQILERPSEMTAALKTQYYIGVDPAFGSSKFGIVLVCIIDDKLCVLESIELDRQDFNYCINKVTEIMYNYSLSTTTADNTKVFVDASAPAVITAIKASLNEQTDYLEIIARRKKNHIRDPMYDMAVIPVNFTATEKKNMLLNLKELIDSNVIKLRKTSAIDTSIKNSFSY